MVADIRSPYYDTLTKPTEYSDIHKSDSPKGEDRPRKLTLQEALTNVLGAYQQSQDTIGKILDNMHENKRLQEEHQQEIREDLQALNTTVISIAGVMADMANIMREWSAHQRAPTTRQSTDQPSTSAASSGQEAVPQDL
ncbi:hypothetical protein NDU88_001741 [Pleurodeles waltl]|uniref:Uncharacterized protein n=1 Tax=Pleurodeles waltl TaxID=8319 RepID=A0AAV7WJ98_PLEWA|nr:hypothetical protein NDU88_001741 [Pleurodeles waltl]